MEHLFGFLTGKINLLIIDDDKFIIDSMSELFSSELFNITCCSNFSHANELMSNKKRCWHTWLVDLAIEHEGDGIELLSKWNYFPYSIVLSGLGSMGMAVKAMQAGALGVFDKNPATLEQLHRTVCATASLGFLLQGKQTQYMPVFSLLINQNIDSTETWANSACITNRQLERICKLHTQLTPRFFRPVYYALWYTLMNGLSIESHPRHQSAHPFAFESTMSAIEFFEKNVIEIRSILLE